MVLNVMCYFFETRCIFVKWNNGGKNKITLDIKWNSKSDDGSYE